jgi:hypothetical protein
VQRYTSMRQSRHGGRWVEVIDIGQSYAWQDGGESPRQPRRVDPRRAQQEQGLHATFAGDSAARLRPSIAMTSAVDPLSKDDHESRQVSDRSTSPHVAGGRAVVPKSSPPRVPPSVARRRHTAPAAVTSCRRDGPSYNPMPTGTCLQPPMGRRGEARSASWAQTGFLVRPLSTAITSG